MDSLNSSEETSTGYNLRSRGKTPNEALNSRTEMEGKIDERVQKYNGIEEEEETKTEEPSQRDVGFFGLGTDRFSVCVLMILYILQGVPLGLSGSIPILIQKNVKGYDQLAAFSIVTYPFSVKLLWAPLVDCLYSRKLGRRKTWLVPLQLAIGGVMLYIPNVIGSALGHGGGEVNISVLAGWFCFLTFLAATQDIAVDGWALTMLSTRNIGWASTCNSVGQTIGYFFGYLGFLALDSPMFCNLFRSEELDVGCVSMESYLRFWGVVFITTTICVAIFVREKKVEKCEEDEGFVQTYKHMYTVFKLRNVLVYAGCIFVLKASFAPIDSLAGLKLLESGVPKDSIVTLSALLIPLQIVLPLFVTKYTNPNFPLNTFVTGVMPRILGSLLFALLVYYAFTFHQFNTAFYVVGLAIQVFYSSACTMLFVSCMMFSARVSDVRMGGTYMTLLNTLINLGGTLPQTISLWLVDRVTLSTCVNSETVTSCYMDKETCVSSGGSCHTDIDGFFVLVALGACISIFWKWKLAPVFRRLQNQPLKSWHVSCN